MDKSFSCPLCPAKVRTLAGLRIHVRRVHAACGRNKKLVAEVSALPERAVLDALHAPSVCHICGYCCTSSETLDAHMKSAHLPTRRKDNSRPRRESASTRRETSGDLLSFATSVRARAKESITGELPHLCCTDASGKPVAVYVPIFLTEAESEILVQLSCGRNDLAPPGDQRKHEFKLEGVSALTEGTSPVVSDSRGSEILQNPRMSLAPDPVDIEILNEVFEVVCNESQLSDCPKPEYRTFAVSEDMLQKIDLASDEAEVFEFVGDFGALMGRELYLHDVGDTIEFHVLEPDGSFTVMKAVRKMDAKLQAVPNPMVCAAPPPGADFWTPPFTDLSF